MIQELINNILKHAKPKQIRIISVYENDQLAISIYHDGKGLTQKEFEEFRYKKEGLGLKNIQNRVILLKGKINFSSDKKAGNYININVPVTKQQYD